VVLTSGPLSDRGLPTGVLTVIGPDEV